MKKKPVLIIAFAFYMLLLVFLVIFKLDLNITDACRYRQLILIPFYRPGAINMRIVIEELVFNVLAFIPLGLYLSALEFPKKAWARILTGLGLSLVFEIAQYVFAIGTSDVTDLINNTLGTAIGVFIYIPIKKLLKDRAASVTAWALLILQLLLLLAYFFLYFVNI
ncbi:MAG: VanZ family protein [Clostridiales bacterium]|nr:VanZ family protein [Clostridiales bacterium]